MRGTLKKTVAIAIVLILILTCVLSAFAAGEVETRTVRVGFYYTEGYHMMDGDGERSGYGYEVLQAMKLYNNWTYEYIGYDKGWADIQKMILDGEVDLVVSAVKTPARMEIYDFSERPVGQSGACLMVKAGESPFIAGDYASYDGMSIGFIENNAQIASTEDYAEEKGFTYEPVYYKTSAELENAIMSGEVDAIVTSNMRIVAGTRRLELFAMQDIHAMVQKGNAELLSEVDYALEQISLYNGGLYDSLYNKYYSLDAGDDVFYTPEETEFIDECKDSGWVLKAALVPDTLPYSYYEGDVPNGILYEVSSEIMRRTGLDYELIVTKSDAEYRSLIESGGVDLQLTARFDSNYAEKLGFKLTDPYYSTDISRVTLKGHEGAITSVATVQKSILETYYLPKIITDETVSYYGSVAECTKAVLSGDCDAVYLFTRTAQEVAFSDETNRLASGIMPSSTVGFSIGVRDTIDSRLASILEKASESLGDNDIAGIEAKYTDYTSQPMSLVGLLYNNPVIIVAIVALILILIFAIILIVFTSRKRAIERENNRKLQAALDYAEEANNAKSVFMSRMSHEIRTPLNAIIGYNSISSNKLAEAESESDYRQAAMQAMDCLSKSDIASNHLLTVINDVLDMSAIESGKMKLAHDPFDFKELISALTVMFIAQAREKNIIFDVVFDTPTDEWFIGDQMRINQVLTNLLSNAVKFTPVDGSVKLIISQKDAGDNKADMRFEVSDTGIGMSSEFMSNIFKPFEQADNTISRRFGGTGLGLSIAKNIVDLMGGTIGVESEVGVGSTLTVEFSLERMEQPTGDRSYDFSGVNVLVADDDRSTCDYLKLLFDRAGARCATVGSGEAAVAAIAEGVEKNDPYTLCVIDWRMPEMDGLVSAKKIRENAGGDIPIVVISAYDFPETDTTVKDAGVDFFISKPLFQSTVGSLLSNLVSKQGVSAAVAAETPDFGGARVMLAEDNKMNMEIAKAYLTTWNLTVDEAWNGREAVEMFCGAPAGTYKAIFMDIHMPVMDGLTATRAIRDSGREDAAKAPIIAMTADVFAEEIDNALAAGMDAHIGKPIEKTVLLEVLRKYLGD